MNLKLKQWIDGYIGKALVLVNVVLVRGLGLLLKRDHSLNQAPENILVIKMLGLGSVLMASDSIYSLKKKYPQAKIILLSGKGVAPGIEPLGLFDEIWINNDSNFFTLLSSGFGSLAKAIRLKNLWVIDLEVYSVLTTLYSAWTMARNRFGFQLNKVHFRNYLNTHNVYFNQFVSVYQNYESLVKAAGVSQISKFTLQAKATENPFSNLSIAINNTCSELGGELRKLPEELLVQTVNYLLKQTQYTLVLTGAPSDYAANQAFLLRFGLNQNERIKNIAGELSFEAYYSFLQNHCAAMISIDSAPFHMAIKAGIPTLSFWGPINPMQRFDFENQDKHISYYLQQPCSPCIHLSDIIPCGGNNICMKNMEINAIENKLNQLLAHTKNA
jgi:ADP-heptose:LPS heptosyltransferase